MLDRSRQHNIRSCRRAGEALAAALRQERHQSAVLRAVVKNSARIGRDLRYGRASSGQVSVCLFTATAGPDRPLYAADRSRVPSVYDAFATVIEAWCRGLAPKAGGLNRQP